MKIWLLTQTEYDGYDTYDSAVVISETEEKAKLISPTGCFGDSIDHIGDSDWVWSTCWPNDSRLVTATFLGEADKCYEEESVVCSSFNAG